MPLILLFLETVVIKGPYLSWVHNPQNTITISWQTVLPESSILEYGLDTTNTYTIINPALDTLHSIEITDLKLSSKYYYRINLNDVFYSFKTAVTGWTPFKFCIIGDTQSDSAVHQNVIDKIIELEPNFVLLTGDCIYNGYSDTDWNTFFNVEKNLITSTPVMHSTGNHEYPFTIYFDIFHFPGNEKWYSFNYGNAHFICLDTEDTLDGEQRVWLENDLVTANINPGINWIFAYFHRPPYSKSIDGHEGDTTIRNAWCGLFEKYGVNMVFSGHNHFYQRTNMINGVTYIINGGGGGTLYTPDTADWIAYSEKTYHCCEVEINGPYLKMNAVKPDGTVFDSIAFLYSCEENDNIKKSSYLYESYPNPFTRFTNIRYNLPVKAKTCLKIYDSSGRLLKTLVNKEQPAGNHNISLDAKDLMPGIYFLKLETGNYGEIKKITLLK